MPNTSSAKKALRQSIRRRAQNVRRADAYKDAIRNLKRAVTAGKLDGAKALIAPLYQALDKAAKTNAIKRNKAARLKSRVTRFLTRAGK